MNIKNLIGFGPTAKIEQQSNEEVRITKAQKDKSSEAANTKKGDLVQISEEAKELQNSNNEILFAKELLSKLPSVRAHVIYEALAKIKAGFYTSEEVIEEAATKLLDSSEFKDLI